MLSFSPFPLFPFSYPIALLVSAMVDRQDPHSPSALLSDIAGEAFTSRGDVFAQFFSFGSRYPWRFSLRPCGVSRFVVGLVRLVIFLAAVHCSIGLAQDTTPPPPDPAKVADAQTKIHTLNVAVSDGTPLLNDARKDTAEIKSLTDPSSDRGDAISRVQAIDAMLKTIVTTKLLDGLIGTEVTKARAALPACDKATLGEDVATQCTKASNDADTAVSSLADTKTSLTDALKGIGPYFQVSLGDASKDLDQLDTIWSAPNDISADDFAASVPTYVKSCSVSMRMQKLKASVYASLTSLAADVSASAAVDTAVSDLATKLKAEAKKVDAILAAMQKAADDKTKKVSDSITAVAATPLASAQSASDAATEANKTQRGIVKMLAAWPDLEASIKSCEGDRIHLAKLQVAIRDTQSSKSKLQEKLSLLNDALVGDPNQFTEDAVPLFFYAEVEKLMRSLNERTDWAGGSSTAATVAASQRELLLDAESRVEQARGEVADLQFELAKLQEEQRKADAASGFLGILKQKADLNKKNSDSNLARATDDLNRAQTESDADPTNAKKKAQLQKAKERNDTATKNSADAATKQTDADTNVKNATAQQTASNDDKDSLKNRIDLATSKLGDAQRNMEEMQRSAYRAALTESDAFAAARDQAPYLEAPALSTSPDPVKRVIMRGYPDRNLILLRGKPEDIAVIRRIITAFDIPSPQARLTLWSFEISAEVNKGFLWFRKPADNLNEATAIVDQSLGVARAKIAKATNIMRENVNEAVSKAETLGLSAFSNCTQVEMPLDLKRKLTPSEQARWRRFRFYSPAVLIQAGVNMNSAESFQDAVLPDPAATTTVGEALMILNLSCRRNRMAVFNQFQTMAADVSPETRTVQSKKGQRISGYAGEVDSKYKTDYPQACFPNTAQALQVPAQCAPGSKPSDQTNEDLTRREKELVADENRLSTQKAELATAMSATLDECKGRLKACEESNRAQKNAAASAELCPDPIVDADYVPQKEGIVTIAPSFPAEGITDMQLEIVRALRSGRARKILTELQELRDTIAKLETNYQAFRSQRTSSPSACRVRVSEIESLYNRYNGIVNTELKNVNFDYRDFQLVPGRSDFNARVTATSKQTWEFDVEAAPRVAAADEMLKRMMGRLEDDLDGQYIQPMLAGLRRELTNKGLTVGIVQRTSVLATNRLKARVDPKGMYDLSVGDQQDLLASIGQLASIYLSAQTGGALSAFGTLNSLNQKQEQRIYGVTTGNKFEVTPIFDPSGQALRFKFDYVSNSMVRNPKGTVDPSMPTIRHTVNTEVQLSNLEIREISRYESNAKLGIPTRYYGGIPILTDIPGLKPIPLIGWFVRRGGSNAEVQQSVIFGQTTIYPTIGSIVDLLQTGN